jgi:uncharacterized protein (DUF433 family)
VQAGAASKELHSMAITDLQFPGSPAPFTIVEDPLPLRLEEGGTYRVGKTRVCLDTVVWAYNSGSSAQEIVRDYPSLNVADVHSLIGYYLRHRGEVDAYLAARQEAAEKLREEIEALPQNKGLREKLLARQNPQA